MNENTWKEVKDFYNDTFGFDGELVDLAADIDILLMCVAGASNASISKTLEIDEDIVETVLVERLDFDGWDYDLDVDPWSVYLYLVNDGKCLFGHFKSEMSVILENPNNSNIQTMYRICKKYDKINRTLETRWE